MPAGGSDSLDTQAVLDAQNHATELQITLPNATSVATTVPIRALTYDGTGYWIITKRISRGKFLGWPKGNDIITPASARELQRLCHNYLTLSRMKKLLGMVIASEKLKDQRPAAGDNGSKCSTGNPGRTKKTPHTRRPKAPSIKPTAHHHQMEGPCVNPGPIQQAQWESSY